MKHKLVRKNSYDGSSFKIDIKKIEGFKVSPKINTQDGEASIKSLVLINRTFIEKVLKTKIKHKLDTYINYIISLLNDDGSDDGTKLNIALGDIERYKAIIEYKYSKYLDDKYVGLLLKKIDILEHELKRKIIYYNDLFDYQEEKEQNMGKSR